MTRRRQVAPEGKFDDSNFKVYARRTSSPMVHPSLSHRPVFRRRPSLMAAIAVHATAVIAMTAMTAMTAMLVGSLTGCGERGAASSPADGGGTEPRLTIVATTGMIADAARRVAGERAEVTGLMGSGVDPHLYKPTRSDVQRLLAADVILYNGLGLEGKLTETLDRASNAGKTVRAVAEPLNAEIRDTLTPSGDSTTAEASLGDVLLSAPEGDGPHDPHVWMDPALWTRVVGGIRDALIEADPAGEVAYRANAARHVEEIAGLEAYAAAALASVAPSRRVLVTAHDAFNYFGRRFDFEVVGIQGISTQSEAGVRDIERLVELLVERGIPAVFVESTVSDRNVSALVAGAAARGHQVVIGGELFSDAMGDDGTYEGTYVGMIDHNVTTIARGLGGTAPARGMSGRLTASGRSADATTASEPPAPATARP